MLHDQKQTSEDWLELVNQKVQSSRFGLVQPYWRLASRVCNQVKAIATESFWVVEVLLCWLVALPVVLLAFFGLILWEKIEAVIPVRRTKRFETCVLLQLSGKTLAVPITSAAVVTEPPESR